MINKKCKFCDKEIEGHTEKQVEHLMNVHIITQHKDRIIIQNDK